MYKNLKPLEPEQHRDLLFYPKAGYSFARELTTCLLAPFEIPEAAKEYPIVFTQTEPCLPQAVLYAGYGDHPFLSHDGTWRGRYTPAYLRLYPFILGVLDESEEFTLMADMDAEHFKMEQGVALFNDDLTPGEILSNKIKLLQKFNKSLQLIKKVINPLKKSGFFSNEPVMIQKKGESSIELAGFSIVKPKTLNSLSSDQIMTLVNYGLLEVFYAHQHSLTNFRTILEASGGLIKIEPSTHTNLSPV